MTNSLAYILGVSNSLIWSWFFWIHVHPIASIIWLIICFFALVISIEVHQLGQAETSNLTYAQGTQLIQRTRSVRAKDLIDVVIIPPPQLLSYKNTPPKNKNPQVATVTIAQLSNNID